MMKGATMSEEKKCECKGLSMDQLEEIAGGIASTEERLGLAEAGMLAGAGTTLKDKLAASEIIKEGLASMPGAKDALADGLALAKEVSGDVNKGGLA